MMLVGEALQQAALDSVEVAPRNQDVGQLTRLVERPRLKCGHELALVDDTRLKCEQSKKEMAIGGGGHGEAPGRDVMSGTSDRQRSPGREGSVATRVLSHAGAGHASPPGLPSSPLADCDLLCRPHSV